MTNMQRMWVNQPSTLQPHHDRHGDLVLARPEDYDPQISRVYFTRGPTISMQMARRCLIEGWPKHLCK